MRIGTPGEFACLAGVLKQHGFNEQGVCAALKLQTLAALGTLKESEIDLSTIPGPLASLIRIFVLLRLVPKDEIESAFGTEVLEACLSLDLLRLHEHGYYASVFLYPVAGFVVASDRHANWDGSRFEAPADVVFPGIFPGTLRFLRLIARSHVEHALDLCSGSGIGALVLSRSAQKAVAADITERATHFAEFNRCLNQRQNIGAVQGDLYGAVCGATFDRITAHPPYVPSLGDEMIFRDGGEAGESVLRRIVEGLPEFLRPGGTFTALCMGLETKSARFEERVRNWLGPSESEFDLIFACGDEKPPEAALQDIIERSKNIATFRPEQLLEVYRRLDVSQFVYGALFLRRGAGRRPGSLTARTRLSIATDGDCLEWFAAWHDWRSRGDLRVAGTRPRLVNGLTVRSTHQVAQQRLTLAEFLFETDRPFHALMRFTDPWVVPLIARFDGARTVAEVHASAVGEIPASFGLNNFVELVLLLVERGYLEIPECPLPNVSSAHQ